MMWLRRAMVVAACLLIALCAWAQQGAGTMTEDFEQTPLQAWELADGAQVAQMGQTGNVLQFTGPGFAGWLVPPVQDFALQFSLNVPQESVFAVIFRGSGEPPAQQEYQLIFEGNQAGLIRFVNQQEQPLAGSPIQLQPGQWTTVALQVSGGQMTVTVGGQQALSAQDPQPLPPGGLAFHVMHGSGLSIDNVTLSGAGQPVQLMQGQMGQGQQAQGQQAQGQQAQGQQAQGQQAQGQQAQGQQAQQPTQVAGQQPIVQIGQQPVQAAGQQQPAPAVGGPAVMQQAPTVPGQGQLPAAPGQTLPSPGMAASTMQMTTGPMPGGTIRTFVKFTDIEGEALRSIPSTLSGYAHAEEGWIEVLDWSLTMSQQPSWAYASNNLQQTQTTFQPLTIYLSMDRATPQILALLAKGEVNKEVKLEVVRTSVANPQPVLSLELQSVRVLSLRRYATQAWQNGVLEVMLDFDQLKWIQYLHDPQGASSTPVECSFEVESGGVVTEVTGPQ